MNADILVEFLMSVLRELKLISGPYSECRYTSRVFSISSEGT